MKTVLATLAGSCLLIALAGCAVTGQTAVGAEADADAMSAYLAAQQHLPVLERSDWVNVQTDIVPGAVGDGIADDTAAIQFALSKLEGKNPEARAVYLPPGTYRITNTLRVTQVQGGAIYGHGRATRIVWDGPEGEVAQTNYQAEVITGARMFHSNGFGRNLFFGITWDGAGKAAVGVDHDSKGYYETRVRHQYCAFLNFRDSGIRVGHDQKTASAEMMFYDCYFENCGRGISFLAFNDYDNSIARCIFRDCGTGVYCHRGNVYVRDCHFENSSEEDLLLPPHSHSVRRCTSVGANAFVRPAQAGGYSDQLTIQECLVRGWRDPKGAIQLGNRGPVTIFDSRFENPADPASPVVHLLGDEIPHLKRVSGQTLIIANLQTVNAGATVSRGQEEDQVTVIPRQRDLLITAHADRRWRHRPTLPERIFDAQVDFGAKADFQTDDSAAIQAAIDAAAAYDGDAEAYLPHGTYKIGRTLEIGPGQVILGGPIGRRTVLDWAGPDGGDIIRLHNADGAILRQLFLNAPKEAACTGIRVTADRPGAVVLDGIWAGGSHQPEFHGTRLEKLPAGYVVRSSHIDGELTIDRCGDANILLDYYFTGYDAPMTVHGPTGDGFLGVHSAAGSHNFPDVHVTASGSIVFGDFYTEQTLCSLRAEGQPGDRPGMVSISYAKLAARHPDILNIDGYVGQVTASRANMMYRPGVNAEGELVGIGEKAVKIMDERATLPVRGHGHTTLLLIGNTYKTGSPHFEIENATVLEVGNNVWRPQDEQDQALRAEDRGDRDAIDRAANAAFDHWRELSRQSLLGPDAAR